MRLDTPRRLPVALLRRGGLLAVAAALVVVPACGGSSGGGGNASENAPVKTIVVGVVDYVEVGGALAYDARHGRGETPGAGGAP